MQHYFDVEIAKKHGIDLAVIIHSFRFWIAKNVANRHNCFDGRYWTYNSLEALEELFPYWSRPQIKRKLKKLEDKGLFLTGYFNKSNFDRTKWYAFSDELLKWYPSLSAPADESEISNEQNQTIESTESSHGEDETVCSEGTKSSVQKGRNRPFRRDENVPSLSYRDQIGTQLGTQMKENSASGDAACENETDAGGDFYRTKKGRKLTGKRLETFEVFWERFAYRRGKAEAADAWMDIPKLTDSMCVDIWNAASKEAQRRPALEERGGTPKMAQGWISGRRWEDEDLLEPSQPALPYLDRITGLVREHGWEAFDSACQHFRISDSDQYRLAVEKGLETV